MSDLGEKHPWYGPCDGFDNGECLECKHLINRQRAELEACDTLRKTTHKMQKFISERGWGNDGDNMAEILMDRITAAEKVVEAARENYNHTATFCISELGEALRAYDAAKGVEDE